MNRTFGLNFYLKRSKITANGTAPLYLRITMDGQRSEIASKRYIVPGKWNSKIQKQIGNSEDARKTNHFLKTLEQCVFEAYRQMFENEEPLTAARLKERLTGADKKAKHSLIAVFKEHNDRLAALVGKEYARGTLQRYEISLRHTIDFLQWKFGTSDIDVARIDHEFISAYDFYLRSVRKCGNNSAVKYIKNFGKIVRICLANGWLPVDPFLNYKVKLKKVNRVILDTEELKALAEKQFAIERLTQVRDVFLFCCYTGLAYIDVKKLSRGEIRIGVDGGKWVFTKRTKTAIPSSIPLLPPALKLLEQYQDHPECGNTGKLLPVLSNQKMNAYLKEIADVCGINKPLTFHIARHTFATTVTLLNGVPIESVSRMLGHTNIKTTQHYAKILDIKVSKDMQLLRQKFAG